MKVLSLFCIISILNPSTLAFWLDPEGYVPSLFTRCEACAPVEMLRSHAYGIEISSDYITVTIQHANGSLVRLMKAEPSYEFYETMMGWLRSFDDMIEEPQNPSLDSLMRKQEESQIITNEIRHLMESIHTSYPELSLHYGGVAIPDHVYRTPKLKSIMEDALKSAGLGNVQHKRLFQIYPTDYAAAASTVRGAWDMFSTEIPETENVIFDALVVANTSSYLTASWYQFSFLQNSIGYMAEPQAMIHGSRESKSSARDVLEFWQKSADLRTLQVGEFMEEREEAYRRRTGFGKRAMTGNSRLILRLGEQSDTEVFEFAKGLNEHLKATRFNPARLETTVYRDEGEDWAWTPATYIVRDIKDRLDAAVPFGCEPPPPVCIELRACVRQEASGELVICEDTPIPETPMLKSIESGFHAGWWGTWANSISPWVAKLLQEAEARVWLWYCDPLTSLPAEGQCAEAIVARPGSRFGVFDDQADMAFTIVDTVAEYWITGSIALPLLHIPMFWFGMENMLTVLSWAASRVLGIEKWKQFVELAEDLWQNDLKVYWEEYMKAHE